MKIVAGNWKMNKTVKEAEEFLKEFGSLAKNSETRAILCVPFTLISTVKAIRDEREDKYNFTIGAQNVHQAASGTHTGEISAGQLADLGVKIVLVGHSERRIEFNETDEIVNAKAKAVLDAGMRVLLCIGETLEEREAKQTTAVLKRQITQGLKDIQVAEPKKLIVAYEPVWAISAGDPNKPKPVATREQIEEAHATIKTELKKLFPELDILVLYGGSVNQGNAHGIMAFENVDGVLVGGASLQAEQFAEICKGA